MKPLYRNGLLVSFIVGTAAFAAGAVAQEAAPGAPEAAEALNEVTSTGTRLRPRPSRW